MPIDRTLSVTMIFAGFYRPADGGYGGTAQYFQTGSNPPMPNLIDASGNIDMANAPPFDPTQFTQNIDVTFSLFGHCVLQDGTLAAIAWPAEIDSGQYPAMLVRAENGVDPVNNITARWVDSSQTQILIDDDNNDTNTYYYRPAIIVPSLNNYYISCDPQITNKGQGNR